MCVCVLFLLFVCLFVVVVLLFVGWLVFWGSLLSFCTAIKPPATKLCVFPLRSIHVERQRKSGRHAGTDTERTDTETDIQKETESNGTVLCGMNTCY